MRYIIVFISLFICTQLLGQNVEINPTITPNFFAADEQITIEYDVTGTSMQGWEEAWIWLWIPNTSINTPSNVNPANSNTSGSDPAKFTKNQVDGKSIFSISLTLTEFTDGTIDNIKSVGVLIKGNDWSDGQSIDFVIDITDGYVVILDNPKGTFGSYAAGDKINFEARTSEVSTIEVYVDNVLDFTKSNSDFISYEHNVINDGNTHEVKIKGITSTDTDEKIYTYTIERIEAVPTGMQLGINYHDDDVSATLVLHAPNKNSALVIGDFNNWEASVDYLMNKDGDRYWLKINGLTPGVEYRFQYLIDGNLRIADPYTEKIGSPFDDAEIIADGRYPGLKSYPTAFTSEAVGYLQTAKTPYNWTDASWEKPAKKDLVIYELLVRDFTDERTYNAVTSRLDYLKNLGINAIHIMPVTDFEGNISWGYNPAFMFAADKYYGTENELKNLINEAHNRGIAIVLDQVLNHTFGRNPLVRMDNDDLYGAPKSTNVWLNRTPKHDFNVGYDFNHESEFTQAYVDRANAYWIKEYHVDGYRFDLSKGYTQKNTLGNTNAFGQYDASRVALLKRMADQIWAIDSDAYVILEHFAENNEEIELANYGMMLWGNLNGRFIAAAKGSIVNIDWLYHGARGWDSPHVLGYMESHDEERVMWELIKSGSNSINSSLERLKLNAAFFFMVPGPKLMWQFGEMGYDEELNNDRLGIKPTRWEYLEDANRKKLHDVYTSLINLKTKNQYLGTENFSWDPSGRVKWINLDNTDVKISVIGNFSTIAQTENAHFISDGTWYDYFSGNEIEITDFQNREMTLQPGEFHIYTSSPIDNYIASNPILSVENGLENSINVYPNPTSNIINLDLPINTSNISITDMMGKKVFNKNVTNSKSKFEIDISLLDNGIYFIELKSKEASFLKKIVKN